MMLYMVIEILIQRTEQRGNSSCCQSANSLATCPIWKSLPWGKNIVVSHLEQKKRAGPGEQPGKATLLVRVKEAKSRMWELALTWVAQAPPSPNSSGVSVRFS